MQLLFTNGEYGLIFTYTAFKGSMPTGPVTAVSIRQSETVDLLLTWHLPSCWTKPLVSY